MHVHPKPDSGAPYLPDAAAIKAETDAIKERHLASMSKPHWHKTESRRPEDGQRVIAIDSEGSERCFEYKNGLWFPEGSGMYVYYQPAMWRPAF